MTEARTKQPIPIEHSTDLTVVPNEIRDIISYARILERTILNLNPHSKEMVIIRLQLVRERLRSDVASAEVANFLAILEESLQPSSPPFHLNGHAEI